MLNIFRKKDGVRPSGRTGLILRTKQSSVRGSALLTALLVMGILIAVSLALSSLIFREVRVTRSFIDAGQAYYSAESGIEIALYGLNTQLPGWELADDYKSFKVDGDGEMKTVGEVRLKNSCKAYPCFDEEEFDIGGLSGEKLKEFYDVLDLNESINIPLFVVKKGADDVLAEVPVDNFTVEFYSEFNPKEDLKFNMSAGAFLSGWDVLRWKVFGIRKEEPYVTESVSDFTALSAYSVGGETHATSVKYPSWFGTADCDDSSQVSQNDRYSDEIICAAYTENIVVSDDDKVCSNLQAREYYFYTYEGDDRSIEDGGIQTCYPVKSFLDSHKLNYLSLTNLMNPAVFKEGLDKESLSKIYFRVELFSGGGGPAETAREVADITSNGYSGDNKQSINVKIRRGSFMPVFHFSLYSTYKDGKTKFYQENDEE